MNAELSRPYVRSQDGSSVLDGKVQLHRLTCNHKNAGAYTIRVTQGGFPTRDDSFTPRDGSLTETEGAFDALIMGHSDDTTVSIRDTGPLPCTITMAEFACTFTPRSQG